MAWYCTSLSLFQVFRGDLVTLIYGQVFKEIRKNKNETAEEPGHIVMVVVIHSPSSPVPLMEIQLVLPLPEKAEDYLNIGHC